MGLEEIQEEVIRQTEKIGAEKVAQATKKAEEIKQETKELIAEEERKAEKETEALIKQLKIAIEAATKFEIKKMELTSKKETIEQVFEKAKQKISELDEKTQERLTNILLFESQREIQVSKIFCNKKTTKWMPKNFEVHHAENSGGVIAENKDGTLRVDNTFETILEEVRKDALKKIAKSIF